MDNDPLFLVEWQGGTQVVWLASTRSYTAIAFGSPEFSVITSITLRAHQGRRSGNYLYCATHLGLESGLDMGYGYKEL